MSLQVFDRLVAQCSALPRVPFAVVAPTTDVAFNGAMAVPRAGLIDPILVGPERQIRALASALGVDPSTLVVVDAADDEDAARRAVAICAKGEVRGLMKSSLLTDVLMHAVLDGQSGLRTARRVS